MTDETPIPPTSKLHEEAAIIPAPGAFAERPTDPAQKGLLAVVAVLVLLLLVGGFFAYRQGTAAMEQIAQLQGEIDSLGKRAGALEARPTPQPIPNLQQLQQQAAAVEPLQQRVTTLEPLQQRVTALEKLPQRLTDLENKPPAQATLDAAAQQQIAAVSSRIDGVAARQDQLGVLEQADVGKIAGQITGLDTRLSAATKAGNEITAINARQARTAQLQAASAALAAGRPLGTIDGAPPALAAFATKPPPTEASLRLSFDAAAAKTREAGMPPKETTPFLTRMLDRAQSGLVVRQGDRLLVGDPVSGVLDQARRQLEAGDLSGAVSALDGLSGPAAVAMAPWRAEAQALLDLRAALASVARG